MLRKLLFRIAKLPLTGRLVGIAFCRFAWAIPVKRVYESKDVLAFCHPQPSYAGHMVIVPKRPVPDLRALAGDGLCGYFEEIWEAAAEICAARPEFSGGAVLMANGGKRQEVGQVHFHLFTGRKIVNEAGTAGQTVHKGGDVFAAEHAQPNWEKHFVLRPAESADRSGYFRGVLRCIGMLDGKDGIVHGGYALVYQGNRPEKDGLPVFHIVSGKRLE